MSSHRAPRLVLLGKQGAGKGTQAARLAEHYGVDHVSTGDLFRAAAREGTPVGLQAQGYIDRGDLVPDDIVMSVVDDQFRREGLREAGFVLDGFPRTRVQAEALERMLGGHPIDLVIDLDVPTETVLHRIAGRRVCEECGATYHVDNPPKVDWTCDVCGGAVVHREDDTEEAVMRRLELYEIETLPVIHFYRRGRVLAHVDGSGETDAVFKKLVGFVDSHYDPSSR